MTRSFSLTKNYLFASLTSCAILITVFDGRLYAASSVSIASLKSKYRDVENLSAKLEVIKTSKFLSKPIRSNVNLTLKAGMITWETRTPIYSKTVLDRSGITLGETKLDTKSSPAIEILTGMVRSLLMFDWKSIDSSMNLKEDGSSLRATPKDSNILKLLTGIDVEFDSQEEPKFIHLKTAQDETQIEFKTFKFENRKK